MENKKIGQGVKSLRKRQGLSQGELSKSSGLSLRTIQRVENGETEPTGETLKRISTVLNVTPDELIDWGIKKEIEKYIVKAKNEYLHVFDSKLIISTTGNSDDSATDYGKSVNNFFKTLMVFIISIPIFTALAIVLYTIEKNGLAILAGTYAFFLLVIAFYVILFTSGTSFIKREHITKIKIQKKLSKCIIVIFYKEFGRLKKRPIHIEENKVDKIKTILFSERLITEKDINLKENRIRNILPFIIIAPLNWFLIKKGNNDIEATITYYGIIILSIVVFLIFPTIKKLVKPLFNKTTSS